MIFKPELKLKCFLLNRRPAASASIASASSGFSGSSVNKVQVVAQNFAPGIQEQASGNDYQDYEDRVYSPYSFDFQSEEDGSARNAIYVLSNFESGLQNFDSQFLVFNNQD